MNPINIVLRNIEERHLHHLMNQLQRELILTSEGSVNMIHL